MNADTENKSSELKKRTITALVLLAIVAIIIYSGGIVFNLAVTLLLVQMLREFYAMQKNKTISSLTIILVLASAICCAALIYIEEIGLIPLVWLACTIAATDIGAYFVGRKFGKHKIYPPISPNKTWEGAIGGFALAALVTHWFGQPAILGVIIGILAQMGDFAESSVKRKLGVKDSGNLLPGHGGILDRLDGYLFAAPFAALLMLVGVVTW